MAKAKIVYYCTACGNETAKWQGKCAACGAWNTIEEHIEKPSPITNSKATAGTGRKPQRLCEVTENDTIRFSTEWAS